MNRMHCARLWAAMAWVALWAMVLSGEAVLAQSLTAPGSLVSMRSGVAPLSRATAPLIPAALPLVPDRAETGAGTHSRSILPGGETALPLDQTGALPLGAPLTGRNTRHAPGRDPRARRSDGSVRCTPDGRHCIALSTYIPDVCRVIEAAAAETGLNVHFFARLLWRESRFDATAVSHAGAQGIAQFMPGTARERGLADAFNPAEALFASAHLLTDLRNQFGNLGLAAAAYNAGGGRVGKFVAGKSGLPRETRDYVAAITGFRGQDWRDGRPRPDYRLDGARPFQTACRAKAEGRGIAAFRAPPAAAPSQRSAPIQVAPAGAASSPAALPSGSPPWGAVIASHRTADGAALRVKRLRRRLPDALQPREPAYIRAALPGARREQVTAQYAAASQDDAAEICRAVVSAGVPCVVHRN